MKNKYTYVKTSSI